MSLKLGAKGIIIPFPKAYLGNKLVFQMQQTKRWYNGYVTINDGNIYYSLDSGVTWTPAAINGSMDMLFEKVAYGNDIYVASGREKPTAGHVSYERYIYTSTDRGETWSLQKSIGFNEPTSICFVNNYFFILTTAADDCFISFDGKDWTVLDSLYGDSGDTLYDMAYGNGQYVALLYFEEENYVPATWFYTSTNGIEWNLQTDYPLRGVKLDKIAFGNGKFIAAGSGNTYYYSINGITWTPASFPEEFICCALEYSEGYGFMVTGTDGSIYCSPTGLTNSWVALEGCVEGSITAIEENGSNIIIAVNNEEGGDDNKIYHSKNGGKTFTESLISDYPFYSIATCGKFMVEVEPDTAYTYEYTNFISLVTPIEWTHPLADEYGGLPDDVEDDGTQYIGSNTYGTWTITATNAYDYHYPVYEAFDNNTGGSNWVSTEHASSSDKFYVTVQCPINIAIKPSSIRVVYRGTGNNSKLQGYNVDTNAWEDLSSLTATGNMKDETFTYTADKYYSQFRLALTRFTTSYSENEVWDFQIEAGTIRKTVMPAGYTALQYIQSSGTQYIDTGFKNNQNTRIVMDVQATSTPSATSWFFGGRTSNSDATMGVFYYAGSTKKITADYDGNGQRYKFESLGATERLSIDYNKNVLTINSYSKTFTSATFQSTGNIALFGINTAGEVSSCISAKLYACKIYDNGTLIRDYVPCKNASGVVGLYDLANNQFYTNAGTGTFTAG